MSSKHVVLTSAGVLVLTGIILCGLLGHLFPSSQEDGARGLGRGEPTPRRSASALTERIRRSETSPGSTAARENRQAEAPGKAPGALDLGALTSLLDELAATNGEKTPAEVEALMGELLERWASAPQWPELLRQLMTADPPLDEVRGFWLALIARCWLANAFGAGRYHPDRAASFVYGLIGLVARAPADSRLPWMLQKVLCQDRDGAEAFQLLGIPEAGRSILAQLPEDGESRRALLELLSDWGVRNPDHARGLLMDLLHREERDLRFAAYRALLRAESGAVDGLLPVLRAEAPELTNELLHWMGSKPELFPPARFVSILRQLDEPQLAFYSATVLGVQLLQGAHGDGESLAALYGEMLGDTSPAAARIREALLIGMGGTTDSPGAARRLHEASYEASTAPLALQGLARVDPETAAIRLLELATSPGVEPRSTAIFACGNLLRNPSTPPMAPLVDGLLALLEDSRLGMGSRRRLAEQLRPFRPREAGGWLERNAGNHR